MQPTGAYLLADVNVLVHEHLHEERVGGDGHARLLRLLHVPVQARRHVARGRPVRIECIEQQCHRLALNGAQPTVGCRLSAPDHAVSHEVVHRDALLDGAM